MREFNYEIIEQYLAGELQGAELHQFEQALRDDPALAAETQLLKDMQLILQRSVQDEAAEKMLQQSLHNKGKTWFKPAPVKMIKMRVYRWYLRAAAAAAVFFFTIRLLFSGNPSTAKILAEYDQPGAMDIGNTRGKASVDTLLNKAAKYYTDKEYGKALPLIDSVLADTVTTDMQLYRGICLFETGNYEGALSVFGSIINNNGGSVSEARFWQALVFVKQENRKAAVEVLRTLLKNDAKHKNAKNLLDDLD